MLCYWSGDHMLYALLCTVLPLSRKSYLGCFTTDKIVQDKILENHWKAEILHTDELHFIKFFFLMHLEITCTGNENNDWNITPALQELTNRVEITVISTYLHLSLTESKPINSSAGDFLKNILWPLAGGSVGWSIVPYTKKLQDRYPVRTRTQVVGLFPVRVCMGATDSCFSHWCLSLFLFLSLHCPPFLSL